MKEKLYDDSYEPIKKFKGDNFFLSNYYPCKISYNGIHYENSEAAFQAQKTLDEDKRYKFSKLPPNTAKSYGRRVSIRSDWEDIKVIIMEEILYSKFNSNLELKKKLIDTYPKKLIEQNTWNDTFWGVDMNMNGLNNLGNILMKIRLNFINKEYDE